MKAGQEITDKEDTQRYSLDDLDATAQRGETVERTGAPTYAIDEDFWANARVVMPPPREARTPINLRIDRDVLEWFRAQGDGHLSRMNAALRSYMEARR